MTFSSPDIGFLIDARLTVTSLSAWAFSNALAIVPRTITLSVCLLSQCTIEQTLANCRLIVADADSFHLGFLLLLVRVRREKTQVPLG